MTDADLSKINLWYGLLESEDRCLMSEDVLESVGIDEQPASQVDAVAEGRRGPLVVSDGHCPLVVDSVGIKTDTEHAVIGGAHPFRVTTRQPSVVLERPTECPTCGKNFEPHQLSLNALTGVRNCAIAASFEADPKNAGLIADAYGDAELDTKLLEKRYGPVGRRYVDAVRAKFTSVEEEEDGTEGASVESGTVDAGEPDEVESSSADVTGEANSGKATSSDTSEYPGPTEEVAPSSAGSVDETPF